MSQSREPTACDSHNNFSGIAWSNQTVKFRFHDLQSEKRANRFILIHARGLESSRGFTTLTTSKLLTSGCFPSAENWLMWRRQLRQELSILIDLSSNLFYFLSIVFNYNITHGLLYDCIINECLWDTLHITVSGKRSQFDS